MRFGLALEDAPFLKSLSTDRSGKVQQLAGRLLARLGEHGQLATVARMTPLPSSPPSSSEGKSGFIRRRTTYTPAKLKSAAQEQRRAELFETCKLVDLAARFGASEAEFIAGWQFGADNDADILIRPNGCRLGQRRRGDASGGTLVADGGKPALFVLHLMPRLGQPQKACPRQADPEGLETYWRTQPCRRHRSKLAGMG